MNICSDKKKIAREPKVKIIRVRVEFVSFGEDKIAGRRRITSKRRHFVTHYARRRQISLPTLSLFDHSYIALDRLET